MVHVEDITSTSVYLWFRVRPCESHKIDFEPAKLIGLKVKVLPPGTSPYVVIDLKTTQKNVGFIIPLAFLYNPYFLSLDPLEPAWRPRRFSRQR